MRTRRTWLQDGIADNIAGGQSDDTMRVCIKLLSAYVLDYCLA